MSITINDTSSATKVAASSTTTTDGTSSVDMQNQFLTLLVAQLQNQDPTNPMDNNQLLSQLAQINTVSGIEKLNTTLGSISGQINNTQSLQASTLIGHGVMVPGTEVLVGSETTTPFGVELEQASDAVTATITDSTGKVVQTLDLGALTAGVHAFNWDAKTSDGTTAPDGAYKVSIAASVNGAQQVAQPLNYALVNSVTNSDSGALLDLGLRGKASLEDVRQIL